MDIHEVILRLINSFPDSYAPCICGTPWWCSLFLLNPQPQPPCFPFLILQFPCSVFFLPHHTVPMFSIHPLRVFFSPSSFMSLWGTDGGQSEGVQHLHEEDLLLGVLKPPAFEEFLHMWWEQCLLNPETEIVSGPYSSMCPQNITHSYFETTLGFFNSPSSLKRSLHLVWETGYGTDGT